MFHYLSQVDITCNADSNGPRCNDIDTPEPECASNVDTLEFTFIGGDCGQSRNTQDDFFCQDSNGGPADDDSASIDCVDDDGNEIFQRDEVPIGSLVTLGGRGDDFPGLVQCFVRDNRGDVLQTFTVGSARFEDLYLKDIFGSLQLESCGNLRRRRILQESDGGEDDKPFIQNCLVPIEYIYNIQNDGNTPLRVTELNRARAEIAENDALGLVKDKNLLPGEDTPAREADVLDVCIKAVIGTDVTVVGAPPSGSPIKASDSFDVHVNGIPVRKIPSGKGKGGKGTYQCDSNFQLQA